MWLVYPLEGIRKGHRRIATSSPSFHPYFLDHENGQAIYFRIVRITTERLVIRNPDGGERIYDRLL